MSQPARKTDSYYTFADYLTWDDDERWEIIEGKVYAMVPAPVPEHQIISRKISRIIDEFLDDKDCELIFAPVDVIFADDKQETKDSRNVVQPDIIVVCDDSKITDRGIVGSPDICIEIISPSTGARDKKEKFYLYEKYGVKEKSETPGPHMKEFLSEPIAVRKIMRFTREELHERR